MMKHPIYLLLPLLILWLGCGETGQNAETQSEETTTAEVYFCEITPPANLQARAAALEETYKKLKEAEEGSDDRTAAEKEFFCLFPESYEQVQKIFAYTEDSEPLIAEETGWEITEAFANLKSIPKEEFYPKYISLTINGVSEAENPAYMFGIERIIHEDPQHAVTALKQRSQEDIASTFRFLYDEPEIGNLSMAYEDLQKILEQTDPEIAAIHKKTYDELKDKWARIFEGEE